MNSIAEHYKQDNRALRHSRTGGKARQVAPHPHKTQPTALSLLYVTSSTSITQTSIPPKHANPYTTQARKPVQHPREQISVTLKAVRHKELCNYPAYQGRQDNHITYCKTSI
jgi:hypothetical protein